MVDCSIFTKTKINGNLQKMKGSMSMKITPQILAAVQRAVEHYGNTSQVAKTMGVAHSTVFFWLNGKTNSISGKLWQTRIRPVLAPFLPCEPGGNVNYGASSYSLDQPLVLREDGASYHAIGGPGQRSAKDFAEAEKKETEKIPVIKFSDLEQFDPSAAFVRKFVRQNSFTKQEYSGFSSQFHFIARLDNEYPGVFLPGTDLLISTEEYPDNHSIVLARLRETGKLVLGRYTRAGSSISIISLREEEPEITWDCAESLGYTLWSFQVLEAKLDLRDI